MSPIIQEIISNGHAHAGQGIDAETDTDLINADQYYQITGPFTPMDLNLFTHNVDGTLTYVGRDANFLFNGASDIKVDKACRITFGLFRRDIIFPGAETPHDFPAADKLANISITAIILAEKDDYFDVRAKSSVINTKLSVNTLLTTFWGEG